MKFTLQLLVALFLIGINQLLGQENKNEVFVDYIKTVKFSPIGFELGFPMVALNTNAQLILSFDDVSDEVQEYSYTITLMDKNWQPTDLSVIEYLDGFELNTIEEYDFSFKTQYNFTNHQLIIPNEDVQWTKSGNYLLEVFNEDLNRALVIRQRFIVFEQEVKIIPDIVRPAIASKTRTHQEIDFIVDHEGFQIRSPKTEISATILQNERWDNAITNTPPAFLRAQSLAFDYQDKIVFPAGNEFRFLDIRSFRARRGNVAELNRNPPNVTEMYLQADQIRAGRNFFSLTDLNGDFVIENVDFGNRTLNTNIDSVYSSRIGYNSRSNEFDLNCDYADVYFFLDEDLPYTNKHVHILGEFNQWMPTNENKMEFSTETNGFIGKLLLKQGYYDYAYALVDPNTGTIDLESIEGNVDETNNEYTILIYYSAFGQRYDRIIGTVTFTSGLR